MDKQIRVLILEDNPSDAELMKRQLRKAGFDFKTELAQDKKTFLEALDKFIPDIILADYSLPEFDALTAIGLARQRYPEIPVIIVSGAIGEETAIEALKGGATDYVLKDRMNRLETVTHRALQEAKHLAEKRRAEEALKRNTEKFQLLSETASLLFSSESPEKIVEHICKKVMDFLDCQVFFNYLVDKDKDKDKDILLLNTYAGISKQEVDKIKRLEFDVAICGCVARDGKKIVAENIQKTKDKRADLVRSYGIRTYAAHPLLSSGKVIGTLSFGTATRDEFTQEDLEFMQTIANQVATAMERKLIETALKVSEARYRSYVEVTGQIAWVTDAKGRAQEDSPSWRKFTGQSKEEFKGDGWSTALHPDDVKQTLKVWQKAVNTASIYETEYRLRRADGQYRYVLARGVPVFKEDGSILEWVGLCIDITERKKQEEVFKQSEERYSLAQRAANIGSWDWNILTGDLAWSDTIEPLFGFKKGEFKKTYEVFIDCVHPDDREFVVDSVNKCIKRGVEYNIEHRIIWPDNSVHWVQETGDVIRDKNNKAVRMVGIMQDITVRKQAKEELEKLNLELETKVKERTARLIKINKQLGKEILDRRERERFTHARNLILDLMAKRAQRKDFLSELINHLVTWSGFRNVGIRVLNEDGQIPYEVYAGFDQEFLAQENNLSVVSDQCVCIRAINGKFKKQEKPCLTQFGSFYTNDAIGFFNHLSEKEQEGFRGTCIKKGYASLAVVPIRSKDRVIAVIHLADESKAKLEQKTVDFIERLAPLIGEGIIKFNLEEDIRESHLNQNLISELLRLSLEDISIDEILQKALKMLFSAYWFQFEPKGSIFLVEDEPNCLILKAESGFNPYQKEECSRIPFGKCVCGKAALSGKLQFIDSNSSEHEIRYHGITPHSHYCVPIVSQGKRVLGVINLYLKISYLQDPRKDEFLYSIANVLATIIERKRTQVELSKSTELLEQIFSSTNFMIAYLDSNFNFIRVNKAYARVDNKSPEFFSGKNYFDLYPNKENQAIFKRVVETGESYTTFAKSFVYRQHPERGISYWDWSLQPVKDEQGRVEGLVLALVDVTKRKVAEEELTKAHRELDEAKRLSDIGTLAATVAHELRNPLGVIRTAAYNIKRKAQNPLLESHLANIEKKILESEQIITNLLFYSRIKMPHYENANIYYILEECVKNAKKKFQKSKASIFNRYKGIKNATIKIDPLQMREVFTNILNNAYEAFPDGKGRIEIKADLNEKEDQISISFKDNGIGIAPEDLARIHEPFFTTKAKGTGLGLTVCQQIMGLHSGKISVQSEKGKGTTFNITLPIKRDDE